MFISNRCIHCFYCRYLHFAILQALYIRIHFQTFFRIHSLKTNLTINIFRDVHWFKMEKLHFSQCWHHWLLLLFQRSLAWSYSSLPQRIWDWISQKWNCSWLAINGRYMRIQLKVYAFELGYSFFMVLGSMFLAQICLLPRSQIFISNILKPNWVDANNIEISKDYCQQGRQQQLLFQERKSVASQIEWWGFIKNCCG